MRRLFDIFTPEKNKTEIKEKKESAYLLAQVQCALWPMCIAPGPPISPSHRLPHRLHAPARATVAVVRQLSVVVARVGLLNDACRPLTTLASFPSLPPLALLPCGRIDRLPRLRIAGAPSSIRQPYAAKPQINVSVMFVVPLRCRPAP